MITIMLTHVRRYRNDRVRRAQMESKTSEADCKLVDDLVSYLDDTPTPSIAGTEKKKTPEESPKTILYDDGTVAAMSDVDDEDAGAFPAFPTLDGDLPPLPPPSPPVTPRASPSKKKRTSPPAPPVTPRASPTKKKRTFPPAPPVTPRASPCGRSDIDALLLASQDWARAKLRYALGG